MRRPEAGAWYFKSMHFSDPLTNVLQLGLREGMKVADLGTGTGHYAHAAARIVGPEGKVYAIDVQEDMLHHMKDLRTGMHARNIEVVWGNIEKPGGTKLRDHVLDAAILSNTLFQLEHRGNALKEIMRILKPGGRLLVVDWAGSYKGIGPAAHHVISEHTAEDLCIGSGFHKVKDFRAGPHHYGIVFVAP